MTVTAADSNEEKIIISIFIIIINECHDYHDCHTPLRAV
jgi:hypothetical protein